MSASPFDSDLFAGLLGDAATLTLVDDRARVRAMLRVEAALARAEAKAGVIASESAEAIARAAETLDLAPADLAAATARDGVPVPALVRRLREAVGPAHADAVHHGATSQDVIDTALVLTTRAALERIAAGLAALIGTLAVLAERHARTPVAGRTRFQLATPTTFGLVVAGWAMPLRRDLDRLAELMPRFAVVSLSGSSGSLAMLGPAGPAVEAALAADLGLAVPDAPWHSARDAVAEVGGWLSLVAGSLGKLGLDVVLLAQTEVGELRPGSGGGSSTMPHKSNPVAAEVLVALARDTAGRLAGLHVALVHAHQRDGSAWMAEWMALPAMAVAAGAAVRTATDLVAGLQVDAEAMRARIDAPPGLLLSEPAVFALAPSLGRSAAEAAVAEAARIARAEGRHLLDVLAAAHPAAVDWAALRRLDAIADAAAERTRRAVAHLRRRP